MMAENTGAADRAGRAGDEARQARSERFAAALQEGQEELIDRAVQRVIDEIGPERSLVEEIGALRVVLRRLIAMDALEGDPTATAATMARLVDTIARTARADRQLSGRLSDDLGEALTTVLIEMGLGEDD